MDNSVNKYLKDIKKSFPVFQKEEKLCYKNIKNNIIKEYQDNKNVKYEDCVEKFGKPSDIVDSFYEEMDEEFIKSHMKQTSYIKKCILFLILFIMILSAFSYGYRLYYFKKAYEEVRRDQPVQVETTITEY